MENGVKGRALFLFCIWALGICWTLLRAHFISLEPSSFLEIDLIAILIAYVYLCYGGLQAAVFAAVQGLVVDIFSAGPVGFFLSLYLSVCGLAVLLSMLFDLSNPKGQGFIVGYGVLLKKGLFILLLSAFSYRLILSESLVIYGALSVLLTAVSAPLCFMALDRVKARVLIEPCAENRDTELLDVSETFEQEYLRDIEKIRF